MKSELYVKENKIGVMKVGNVNYISLTDLARYTNKNEPKVSVQTWMRNRDVVAYLGLWERLYNKDFKGIKFTTFEMSAEKIVYSIMARHFLDK